MRLCKDMAMLAILTNSKSRDKIMPEHIKNYTLEKVYLHNHLSCVYLRMIIKLPNNAKQCARMANMICVLF